jgi:hypothetical protein
MLKRIFKFSQAANYRLGCGLCCSLFICLGLMLIPYPGIQNDEALFAEPLYHPQAWSASITVFERPIATMLNSYLGTLKTWLYLPWFRLWAPSAWSIRLPGLLIAAATLLLFFAFTLNVSSPRAALAGTVLLATDFSFLLTSCFDWGPVALQHLALMAGIVALCQFHRSRNRRWLATGFFVFGLGLWDKALFVWALVGIAAAALIVIPREVLRNFQFRNACIALLAFCGGAFPFLHYNLTHSADSIRSNVSWSLEGLEVKVAVLRSTFSRGVLGHIPREDSADVPRAPRTKLESLSVALHDRASEQSNTLTEPALVVSFLLLALVWRTPSRRPLLFALIFMGVTWLLMAATPGAGASIHHTILLWPFPIFFIAVALSGAAERIGRIGSVLFATAVIGIAGQNLMVYNQHLAHFVRNGGHQLWTDAIFPLSHRLQYYRPNQIEVVDWGMMNSLRLLGHGTLDLQELTFLLIQEEPGEEARRILNAAISDPSHVFAGHTGPFRVFARAEERLAALAREGGYERVLLETITDANGRAAFEIFRFAAYPR